MDYADVGSSRDALLFKLVAAYEAAAIPPRHPTRCRREVHCCSAPLPEPIAAALLDALRATRWPSASDRPKVASAGYLVLERPARAESNSVRRARVKRQRHAALWAAVEHYMEHVDAGFVYTGVALSRGFRGSPHVDAYDISYQWALSLGNFEGGALCVESAPDEVSVVDTRGKPAKVDGRFPHWVAPWSGERYSVICYVTHGEGTPVDRAVYV